MTLIGAESKPYERRATSFVLKENLLRGQPYQSDNEAIKHLKRFPGKTRDSRSMSQNIYSFNAKKARVVYERPYTTRAHNGTRTTDDAFYDKKGGTIGYLLTRFSTMDEISESVDLRLFYNQPASIATLNRGERAPFRGKP